MTSENDQGSNDEMEHEMESDSEIEEIDIADSDNDQGSPAAGGEEEDNEIVQEEDEKPEELEGDDDEKPEIIEEKDGLDFQGEKSSEQPAEEPKAHGSYRETLAYREKLAHGTKNKIRRRELVSKIRKEKKKEKKKRQDERKNTAEALGDSAPPKLVPKTIDAMREPDETLVVMKKDEKSGAKVEDEETELDIANDEFSEYFTKSYEPKVLITSGDNPHSKTIAFMKELSRIIPNSEPMWRRNSSIKKTIKNCNAHGFTDIIVINEDNRIPNGMVISHLPEGPTASFRLSNVKITKEIKKDWRQITAHRPEVIMNNFTTRLGHTVGRMLASLFHYEPQFKGKRCVTFHNQRDYIFFRHHMYDFKSSEKVKLREMGPRFTLKLRSLQKGTFDSKLGEFEWIINGRRHDMETSRRRFFL